LGGTTRGRYSGGCAPCTVAAGDGCRPLARPPANRRAARPKLAHRLTHEMRIGRKAFEPTWIDRKIMQCAAHTRRGPRLNRGLSGSQPTAAPPAPSPCTTPPARSRGGGSLAGAGVGPESPLVLGASSASPPRAGAAPLRPRGRPDPSRPRCAHEPARPASHKPGGDDISLTPEFLFLERGTPTRIFQRHKLAPSQPGPLHPPADFREGGGITGGRLPGRRRDYSEVRRATRRSTTDSAG